MIAANFGQSARLTRGRFSVAPVHKNTRNLVLDDSMTSHISYVAPRGLQQLGGGFRHYFIPSQMVEDGSELGLSRCFRFDFFTPTETRFDLLNLRCSSHGE